MQITREQALPLVAYCVDDALSLYPTGDVHDHPEARLVGFQAGAEMVFVAVWSYLSKAPLDAEDACELAIDVMLEKRWFANPGDPQDCQPVVVL